MWPMRTYRDAFALGEFRALFGGQIATAAGLTIQTLALSVLVFSRTHSPVLAAVAFLGASLPQALGAMTLSGIADRYPPRSVLVAADSVRVSACLLLASGLLPVGAMLTVVMLSGVPLGAFGGVRFRLVAHVLPLESYALGRSALNTASSSMQVTGFAAGGALLVTVGASHALWVATVLMLTACLSDRFGVRARPPDRPRHASVSRTSRESWALLTDRRVGRLLFAQWVPNGMIVGAEALYVPYSGRHAAVLYVTGATGMLAGDVISGRFIPPGRRTRTALPLYLLLAVPYLGFAAHPGLLPAAGMVGLASIGFGGTLCVQQQMVEVAPRGALGQLLALASAGMLSAQGLAAGLAGSLASAMTPARAIAVMAAMSAVAAIVLLAPARDGDIRYSRSAPGRGLFSGGSSGSALSRRDRDRADR